MVRNLLPQATNIADIKITPSTVLHEKSSPAVKRCAMYSQVWPKFQNAIKTSECSTDRKNRWLADRSFVLPFLSSVIIGLSLDLTSASGISRLQHCARGRSFDLE